MPEVTLENLAQRVEAIEKIINIDIVTSKPKDWRLAIGYFGDSEFMQRVIAEGRAIREADCEAAVDEGKS